MRVSADKENAALEAFGNVNAVEAVVAEEFAFVTDLMTEKEFNEKAEAVGIISRIRVED